MTDTFRKEYTPLSEDQKAQVLIIKTTAELLLKQIQKNINEGERSEKNRCLAISITELETAVMWAVKGITT